MPWYWWLGALALVTAVGVVKGKRTRRKVWRAIRRYAKKRTSQRIKARGKARTAQRQTRRPQRAQRTSGPWKPAPLLTPQPVARRPIFRAQACSLACRKSTKPASTCDCACRGRDHGRYRAGTAANIRATKYTPTQQRTQRRANVEAGNQRWRQRHQEAVAKANGGKPIPRGGKGGQSSS